MLAARIHAKEDLRLDPLEMRQWLPRLSLVDVSLDGQHFTYRLVGTQLVDLLERHHVHRVGTR